MQQAGNRPLFLQHSTGKKWGCLFEAIMNHVDVVVTLGRGIYEAMAMGRAAFIGDRSLFIKEMWADGFATRTTFPESMKYNCNGKRYRVPFTAEFLESQIDTLYCAQLGDDSQGVLAEEHLDVDKASRPDPSSS